MSQMFVSKTYGQQSCETAISSVWNDLLGHVLGRSGNAASKSIAVLGRQSVTVLATHKFYNFNHSLTDRHDPCHIQTAHNLP